MSEVVAENRNETNAASSDVIVQLLSEPHTYAERPRHVRCVETHISWVFLTDRHAYKLKKPVKFDFLDFSTPTLRHEACEHEVRLNRRLAADIYLGVVPITVSRTGGLQLNGKGTPVDWVVKMRRLPADRALDRLISSRQLNEAEVHQLAHKLADFYFQLPPVSVRTEEYCKHILQHVQANRDELLQPEHGFLAPIVKRVHAAQLRVRRLMPELFETRACDGRVVEGHGDLRPEHIYLTRTPTIIDCIEFNTDFRQLDVLDELSFLAVECAYLEASWVGGRVLEQYCETTGDEPSPELLSFYMGYRACVRAKVHALRARQLSHDDRSQAIEAANKYLQLADRYAAEVGPPVVLIVRGLTGSGKSTLAAALAESLGIELLGTDRIRREMFGPSDGLADYGQRNYRSELRVQVYEEMIRRASTLLAARHSVVLDGTFLTTKLRARTMSLARRRDAAPLLVHCQCPDEVAIERISTRMVSENSLSESRPEFLRRQHEQEEADPPGCAACEVDTTPCIPAMLGQVFHGLKATLSDRR